MVPMRDGTKLSTYLYFPPGKGPWPVLYEQRYADLRGAGTRKAFARLAAAGYVVAAQNFRGTHLSEGTWVGYRALGWGEQKDGYDTVEWLAEAAVVHGQGRHVRRLAGRLRPELPRRHAAAAPRLPVHDRHRPEPVPRRLPHRRHDPAGALQADGRRLPRPRGQPPAAARSGSPTRPTTTTGPTEDCTRHFDKMDVPCFTLGSWFDFMCVGSVESFIGRQHQGGPNSRGRQQLLIGPWLHGGTKETNKVGELTYPGERQVRRWKPT